MATRYKVAQSRSTEVKTRKSMTELKKLKKELARYRVHLFNLPILIDCSKVYGDLTYTQKDIDYVKSKIASIEKQIEHLKSKAALQPIKK